MADAMEVVIAALFLDAGWEAARTLVLRLWSGRINAVEPDARDPKTALQQWAQTRRITPPLYTETCREGPDHQPMFTIEVRLASGIRSGT